MITELDAKFSEEEEEVDTVSVRVREKHGSKRRLRQIE